MMDMVSGLEIPRRESPALAANARTLQALASSDQVQRLVSHLAECRPVETFVPSRRFRTVEAHRSLKAAEEETVIRRLLADRLLAQATSSGLSSEVKDTGATAPEQMGLE